MKRDLELCRQVLLKVEESSVTQGWIEGFEIEGVNDEVLSEHVRLLDEAGLIDAQDLSSMSSFCWMPKRLTYQGHEFLDAVRNDTVWMKAKEKVISSTGTLTLEALKSVTPALIKSLLGLPS